MIKIDDKEIRNPIEQIKKNMDDIEWLKQRVKDAYTANITIDTEAITVSREDTNVPDSVKAGWLLDAAGSLFNITGGNANTLMIKYYTNFKGATGPQGPQGIDGNSMYYSTANISSTVGNLTLIYPSDIKYNRTPQVNNIVIDPRGYYGYVTTYDPISEGIAVSTLGSLKGPQGAQGPAGQDGQDGADGQDGTNGRSMWFLDEALSTTVGGTVTFSATYLPDALTGDMVIGNNGYLGTLVDNGATITITTQESITGPAGEDGTNILYCGTTVNRTEGYEGVVQKTYIDTYLPTGVTVNVGDLFVNIEGILCQVRSIQTNYYGYKNLKRISGDKIFYTDLTLSSTIGNSTNIPWAHIMDGTGTTASYWNTFKDSLIIDSNGMLGKATDTYMGNDTIAGLKFKSIVSLKGPQGIQGIQGIQGEQGPAGQDGLTTAVSVNGQTYTQVSGTITLPNYPTVSDRTITLIQNGVSQSFSLNQNSDKQITLLTVKGNTGDTPTATLSDIQIGNTVYSIDSSAGNSSSGIYLSSADLDTTVNYSKVILVSTITLGSNTLAVDDIIIGANKYVGVVTTIGVNPNNQPVAAVKTLGNINDQDLSNYVTTTDLSTALTPYALSSSLATVATSGDYDDLTDKPDLSIYAESANLATVATTGDYTDLTNKPSIPNVYNSTITIQENGTTVDTFKLNQSTAKTINITVPTKTSDLNNDSGYITSVAWNDVTDKPTFATVATTGDYDDLLDKPTIPTAVSQLTNDSGYITSITSSDVTTALGYTPGKSNFGSIPKYLAWATSSTNISDSDFITDLMLESTARKYILFDNTTTAKQFYLTKWKSQTAMTTVIITLVFSNVDGKDINYYNITVSQTAGSSPSAHYQCYTSTMPTKTSDLTNDSGFITGIDSSDVITALGYTPGTSNFSGDYDDLTDKPDLSIYAESANLATVATSGDYDDLIDKPDLSVYELAADAFSGDYNDLTNKPTIPAAQVNSDWNAVSGVAQILNKPTLATVATSGDYDDLLNKPTIPTVPITSISVNNIAQTPVQGNVNLTMNFAERVDVNGSSYTATNGVITLPDYPTLPTLATVATTGDYDDLTNKPTIPTVPITEIQVNSSTVSPVSGVVDITVPADSILVELSTSSGTITDQNVLNLLKTNPDKVAFLKPTSSYGVLRYQARSSTKTGDYYDALYYTGGSYGQANDHQLHMSYDSTNNYYTYGIQSRAYGVIRASATAGLIKNDGTIDTNTYALASSIPSVPITEIQVNSTTVSPVSGVVNITVPTNYITNVTPTSETWTFTLSDNTTVTKTIVTGVTAS